MKKKLIRGSIAFLLIAFSPFVALAQGIYVDASKVENKISPYLYGSCIEDVNHEIYGGFYDQRIFGESFEEPSNSVDMENFTSYEGNWSVQGSQLKVNAFDGAKQIYNSVSMLNGKIEVDLKMENTASGDANLGFLARVSNPGNGADSFNGYEIGLSHDGKKVILARHRWNWNHLADAAVDVNPTEWNKLAVEMNGAKLKVYLNGVLVIDYTDADPILAAGQVGLRTWRSDAAFQHLATTLDNTKESIAFVPKASVDNFSVYDGMWDMQDNLLHVNAFDGAKQIYNPSSLLNGVVEVDLKIDNGTAGDANAGLLTRVSNPGNGADAFNGYEIGLSHDGKKVILARHRWNWNHLADAAVDVNPAEWNKLTVEMNDANIKVYLNGILAIDYTDSDPILAAGQVGVRTWRSDVSFRNFATTKDGNKENIVLDTKLTVDKFVAYDGNWAIDGTQLKVDAFEGAKQVYDPISLLNSKIDVDIKISNGTAGDANAGLLTRVSNPGNGADAFNGYEIGLSHDGKKVILARHRWNWNFLVDAAVDVNPAEWNKLTVEMNDANIKVYLNGTLAIDYTDSDPILAAGQVALRTWRSDVAFQHLAVTPDGSKREIAFIAKESVNVSRMWDAIQTGDATAHFLHIDSDAYNTKYSQEVEFVSGEGSVGVANKSLNKWGIAVKNGQTFAGSLFLKGVITGNVKVALQSADGSKEYAVEEIDNITDAWAKYPFTLTANTADNNARFAIYIDQPGKIRIDQVSLMSTGADQFRGLPIRNDIGQAMVDQGLTFLRYGGTMVNSTEYRFKKMIGPRENRPGYKGHWYTYSTNGFGIEEFLQYCEAAGFEPSFAININETEQDMADMIEYLKGDATTTWGAKRAANGHPAPYRLNYLEIGNEEVLFNGDRRDEYEYYVDRFNKIYDAIRTKDADIKLVNAAWWRPESKDNMKMVFDALNGKAAYWDYHAWADDANSGTNVERELREMQTLFKQWDANTTMKCAFFEENGNTHNMQRALGHATIQNAARRMGDFMLTTCAANALEPYKQNDNGWNQGQVFFTPSQVWGMPPYYAQQMASQNHKPLSISTTAPTTLDVVAATDEERDEVVLYVVNVNDYAVTSAVNIAGTGSTFEVKTTTLSAALSGINTPENPIQIVPVEKVLVQTAGISYTFPAHSYTIMVFKNNKIADKTDASIHRLTIDNVEQNTDLQYYLVPKDHTANTLEIKIEGATGTTVTPSTITVNVSKAKLEDINFSIKAIDGTEVSYKLIVEKYFNFEDIVKVRWNNTLAAINNPANNGGFNFSNYAWFRNGEQIGTKQYYSAGSNGQQLNANDKYYLVVNEQTTNKVLRTWEANPRLKSLNIQAYPNPVAQGGQVYVDADVDDDLLQDATIGVYSSTGLALTSSKVKSRLTPITLNRNPGTYMIVFKGKSDFKETMKVIVK